MPLELPARLRSPRTFSFVGAYLLAGVGYGIANAVINLPPGVPFNADHFLSFVLSASVVCWVLGLLGWVLPIRSRRIAGWFSAASLVTFVLGSLLGKALLRQTWPNPSLDLAIYSFGCVIAAVWPATLARALVREDS